jgi:hypothetical protein
MIAAFCKLQMVIYIPTKMFLAYSLVEMLRLYCSLIYCQIKTVLLASGKNTVYKTSE